MKLSLVRAFSFFALTLVAGAEVTRVEITRRVDVGSTGYEKIVGKVHFAVDPADPHNRDIADLDRAPVNVGGRVEFSSDLHILRPKDPRAGNGAALLEIPNRGGKSLIPNFNHGGKGDPTTDADIGDGFLLRQGFTLVTIGWEFDVPRTAGMMRIEVPVATDAGQPISGVVHATFVLDAAADDYTVTDLAAYSPSAPDGPETRLTVRKNAADPLGREIPRARWQLNGRRITLKGGFEAGKIYELFFQATNPPVAGLGFAAVRDTAAWLKHPTDGILPARFVYGFGSSQSGRFLRSFLYEGFNTDEHDRPAFDGVLVHIAGASRIDLNRRWSLPRALGTYAATAFPFSDKAQRDPVSGATDGLLENGRSGQHAPKIFFTNTAVEYWGGGRVAALTHTDPAGTADLALPENVRSYFLTGAQHGPGRFPPAAETNAQQPTNPADYWWIMRALLTSMHRWVADGVNPPASAYPNLRAGTLVKVGAISFPKIPDVASPRGLSAGVRMADARAPEDSGTRAPLPLLVPAVDEDGNERAGVRLPEVAVPLATYTGWNFRHPSAGAHEDLVPLVGSWIPFPVTRAAKSATWDPRRSIAERYASRAQYLAKVTDAANGLVKDGFLLADDVAPVVRRAGEQWDWVSAPRAAKD